MNHPLGVFCHSSSSTTSKYFPPLLQPPSVDNLCHLSFLEMKPWHMWLSIRGMERGGCIEWKSLACLWRTWNNIIPSWLTQVAWLYLSFLLLILHLFLGLFCCKMGDFGSQRKLLIVLLLRRFEKCSNALENTNVWTVMKHSLNTLIWWHSTPKFINSQLYLEWEKLTVWWMRRMSGHDRKKELRTEWLTRSTGQRWKLPSICQLCIPLHTPRPPFDWLAPFQI